MDEDEVCSFAMEIASGAVPPMVLKAVIELDVLEIIKRAGPGAQLSPADIAAQLPTKNPDASTMLDRMLRLLASYSILTYSLQTRPDGKVERLYGLTPVCEFLTKNEDGISLSALSLMEHDKVHMGSWYHLKDAVLDGGIAFNKAYGMPLFQYHGTDPRFNKVFNNAMLSHSIIVMKRIVETYKGFEGVSTLVDVGGGVGACLNMILSKHPTIKGINFDLPHVIEDATTDNGVENIGGDMFVSIPKGDAIFLKWILHCWTDDDCLKILKNCYDSLPDHGKLIVCEHIIPVAPETSHTTKISFHIDAIMLAQSSGGKERSEEEFQGLAKRVGFEGFRVACSAYGTKVMELFK